MQERKMLEAHIDKHDYKVLVVDDLPINVLLLTKLLGNEGYQTCTANSGSTCIEQARSQQPDLILLDVMMPGINGFDAAAILKKDPATADIPIIFITALNEPGHLVHGFQVGASDYISKPFNKEELSIRVFHQIKLVAARRIIERQNAELRATIANRDKMYSVIAHDLRSPLASIRMVLNLIVSSMPADVIGQEFAELLDMANKECEDAHDLLDNLLKWTKSQTGRLNVVTQELELGDIIPGVVDIFETVAATKGVRLSYHAPETPLVVLADNDMLKTIVRNFLSNAVKFSPEGSTIDITVSQADDHFAKISISDHGVGISPESLDSIFHKGDTTNGTDGEEGSGLGLLLCADFAAKNGGSVTAESSPGKGSTFSVLIPLRK